MRLLIKLPVRVPSVVLEPDIVGFDVIAQQIPLTVITSPPLEVIVPPDAAVVDFIEVTAAVVSTGSCAAPVIKVSSSPYPVPALLVAYDRT